MTGYRTYDPKRVAAFLRVRDPLGAFSNMAGGFPMTLHGTAVPSSEALYQALRFPHLPDFQREILDQPAPVLSKRHAYARITDTRPDWDQVRVNVMRYALRAKFGSAQGSCSTSCEGPGTSPSSRSPTGTTSGARGQSTGVLSAATCSAAS